MIAITDECRAGSGVIAKQNWLAAHVTFGCHLAHLHTIDAYALGSRQQAPTKKQLKKRGHWLLVRSIFAPLFVLSASFAASSAVGLSQVRTKVLCRLEKSDSLVPIHQNTKINYLRQI
jgi:hypothetical protein